MLEGVDNEGAEPRAERDTLYKVAYDEAVRALSEQRASLESFRTRGGLVLSSAVITTSFMSPGAFAVGDSSLVSWAALMCFAGVAVLALAILWPRQWEFSTNPSELIADRIGVNGHLPIAELHHDLSAHMNNSFLVNRLGIRQLATLLQLASALLAAETILWTLAIGVV
jgi:hypothetical protein